MNSDMQVIKNEQTSLRALPRGVVIGAEKRAGLDASTIEKFLKQSMKDNDMFWNDFVRENFDAVVEEKRQQQGVQQQQSEIPITGASASKITNKNMYRNV